MSRSSASMHRKLAGEIQEMLVKIEHARKCYKKVKVGQNRKRQLTQAPISKKSETGSHKVWGVSQEHPWLQRIHELRQVGFTDDIFCGPSKIHNVGVFTRSLIKNGTIIVEYVGEVIDKEEQERRDRLGHGDYFAEFIEGKVLDAFSFGNISKFINHSCNPNCVLEIVEGSAGFTAVVVSATRNIRPSEELTFDYKFEDSDPNNKPVRCNCGFEACRGFVNARHNVTMPECHCVSQ